MRACVFVCVCVTLSQERNMSDKLFTVALGQGQAPVATRLIEDGVREGHWVFLANCHLMTSWLPALDKIVEGLEVRYRTVPYCIVIVLHIAELYCLAWLRTAVCCSCSLMRSGALEQCRVCGLIVCVCVSCVCVMCSPVTPTPTSVSGCPPPPPPTSPSPRYSAVSR